MLKNMVRSLQKEYKLISHAGSGKRKREKGSIANVEK